MNVIQAVNPAGASMTSREIADLCEARHNDVIEKVVILSGHIKLQAEVGRRWSTT
jgi:phage regulator Rha-like protein